MSESGTSLFLLLKQAKRCVNDENITWGSNMKTPYEFLLDLKNLHKLLTDGHITEVEFQSQKEKLLKNVLHNKKYYTTYTCVDEAGKLLNTGVITEKEFEKIKKQAFHDQDPETRNNGGGFFAGVYAFFKGIGIFFDCVIIFGFIALCIVWPPLIILFIIGLIKWWWDTNWDYDNAVKEEIINKAIKRNKN